MLISLLLIQEALGSRQQQTKITKSNFTNIINHRHLLSCPLENTAGASRYTTSCGRIVSNNWSNIQQGSTIEGGAVSISSLGLTTEISRNIFTRCKAKSGAACALSCFRVTFNDNFMDTCETSSKGNADGAVYVFSHGHNSLIYFNAMRNRYQDCNFFKGGGLETTCTNIALNVTRDTYTRCNGNSFGGGVHINNYRGTNEINDCTFVQCSSNIGGAIGYDCPTTDTQYSLKVAGCFIDSCRANQGVAIYNFYKTNSFLNFNVSKSWFNKTIVQNCNSGSEAMFVTAQQMDLSGMIFRNNVGNAIIVNQARGDYKIDRLQMKDCNFTRCTSTNSNNGILMSGRFGNLSVQNCIFTEVSYMWNFPVIDHFTVVNSVFHQVDDASRTRLETTDLQFTFVYESCRFIDSLLSVRITTTVNTERMHTKFDNCVFENMRQQIEVSIPTTIEVKSCRYDGRSNLFRFSSASRSLIIRDCSLTVSDSRFTLITVDSLPRTSYSEVRNCRFTVNAGYAMAVNGLFTETNMNFIDCHFDGSSSNAFMSIRGNFQFEGNVFRRSGGKTTPVIRFMGGRLTFSRTNLNCIDMSFRETFTVDDSRFYDNIFDSRGQKILIWGKNNNLCFSDTTFQFTLSQQFSPSRQFSSSRQFSPSNRFTSSRKFSPSIRFSPSNIFTLSSTMTKSGFYTRSSAFPNTNKFTLTTHFTITGEFTESKQFSKSNQFSKSSHFAKSILFTRSIQMTKSKIFSETGKFYSTKSMTASNHFQKSYDFSESGQFSCSIQPSNTDIFTETAIFSSSASISSSYHFNGTNDFSKSMQFSKSVRFSKTILFSITQHLSLTELLTQSMAFSRSIDFNPSLNFTRSNLFTPSNHKTFSDLFTITGHFSISQVMTRSKSFPKSIEMSESIRFTGSSHLTKSSIFSITTNFSLTSEMTKSIDFTLSNRFTSSSPFTPSDYYDQSHHFTPSSKFSRTAEMSLSNIFSNTDKMTKSIQFSISKDFEYSRLFSISKQFKLTAEMSSSDKFTSSNIFTLSNHHEKTHLFALTNKYSASNKYTLSNQFSKSEQMDKSDIFTGSRKFSGTTKFSLTKIFSRTDAMTETEHFIKSDIFSQSANLSHSLRFSGSNDFSFTGIFNLTEQFNQTDKFSASHTMSFQYDGDQKHPESFNKKRKTLNIGIFVAIVLSILLLAILIIVLLIIYARRKEDEPEEEDNDLETNDGTYGATNQLSTMVNPLFDGETAGEQDPFEFDFNEGESIFQGGMNF